MNIFIKTLALLTLILTSSCGKQEEKSAKIKVYALSDSLYLGDLKKKLAEDPNNFEIITDIWSIYTVQGNYETLIREASEYYKKGAKEKNEKMMLQAGVNIGQAYILSGKTDSMFIYYNALLPIAEKTGDQFSLTAINNGLGIYSLNYANYCEAASYFQKALHYTQYEEGSEKFKASYHIVLDNLVWSYYLREDPYGLKYAEQIRNFGLKENNEYLIYLGTLSCAYMHFINGDMKQAAKYAEEASMMYEQGSKQTCPYTLYAQIKSTQGRDAEAEIYFKKALANLAFMDVCHKTEAYLRYGEYLSARKRYKDAVEMLRKGIDLSIKTQNYYFSDKLYKSLSETYEKTGDKDSALHYMAQYQKLNDDIFNVEKERMFGRLRSDYEIEAKNNSMKDQHIKLLNTRNRMYVFGGLALITVILAVFLWIIYYNKMKSYRKLVLKYEQFKSENGFLNDKISELESCVKENGLNEKKMESAERKSKDLFDRIERMMKEQSLYKDKDLSLKKLADMLDSNTMYVSRAFNQYAGISFSEYINSYRMKEAVSVLADTENDIPLKQLSDELGYSSISSFYRVFQKETGVPPSRYRHEIRMIKKEKTS